MYGSSRDCPDANRSSRSCPTEAAQEYNILEDHCEQNCNSGPIGAVRSAFGKGDGGVWSGNMNAGFMAIAVSILISGLFWLWGARYLERDTALAPTRISPE